MRAHEAMRDGLDHRPGAHYAARENFLYSFKEAGLTASLDPRLLEVALGRASGADFEAFTKLFMPALIGQSFVPLGGVHDGGADGFGEEPIYCQVGHAGIFYQASTEKNHRSKIRATVARLRQFGRRPTRLTYLTAQLVKHIDVEEDALTDELGISIRIRDQQYFISHVNDNDATRNAFNVHLKHYTDFLSSIGSPHVLSKSRHVTSPTVYVFLRQELDRRQGNGRLSDAVTDALILWSLEGTDPDAKIFMTQDEIRDKIFGVLPVAEALIGDRLRPRLQSLTTKKDGTRLAIDYGNRQRYCLPYETRKAIELENVADEALRLAMVRQLQDRVARVPGSDLDENQIEAVAKIVLCSLEKAFEQEGLEFSRFITDADENEEHPAIIDFVREAIDEIGPCGVPSAELKSAVLSVVRGCFYASSAVEREYLGKLARTYSILFTLNSDPRLIQYFQEMSAGFYLYVGTDMLIRALSERYLPESDQICRNTLRIARSAGATLILTEPVLEEIRTHLQATDQEYRNHFAGLDNSITVEIATHAPKILIRAYFYSRIDGRGPSSWQSFVDGIVTYRELYSPTSGEELRMYLMEAFGLQYRTKADLQSFVAEDAVASLAEKLAQSKDHYALAYNDALIANAVYGRRLQRREQSTTSEFGYLTWWLTHESKILRHTVELVASNGGIRYMMRPDFLLNFLALAPSVSAARSTFHSVFPSALGLQLSNRMNPRSFHKLMDSVREAEAMDDARRKAALSLVADRLKGDFGKEYAQSIKSSN